MEVVLKNVASAALVYTTHYATTKLYSYICVPDGLVGYLNGFISTGSPICSAGIQVIGLTQTTYASMVLMAVSRLLIDLAVSPTKDSPVKS